MNCLEFRRQIFTDPTCRDDNFLLHRQVCRVCSPFAQSMALFEQDLLRAIQVNVPDDLASRIKLQRTIHDEQRSRRRRPWRYAMAASLVLMLGVSSFLGYRLHTATQATEALQQAVLQHIHMELNHLAEHNPVQVAQLNQLMAPFGVQIKESFGLANYAGACPIGQHLGAHLVVQGQVGPVTIIFVPSESIADRSHVVDQRFSGILLPAGKGGMAIVGERGEPLDDMVRKVKANVVWNL